MPSSPTTGLAEVLVVLRTLRGAGCRCWVAGGWGVDALVGRQTRAHRDLDLAVPHSDLDRGLAALEALGYRVETDSLPVRVALHRPGHGRVDLHPVVVGDDGHGVQAGFDGEVFHYPPACFVHGRLDDAEVACLSRAQQIAFHRGYEPRASDRHDLALLSALQPDSPTPIINIM